MVTYLQNAGAPTFLFRARRLRIVAKADGHLKVAATKIRKNRGA